MQHTQTAVCTIDTLVAFSVHTATSPGRMVSGWVNKTEPWDKLVKLLQHPRPAGTTRAAYAELPKNERNQIKASGGALFGGHYRDGHRSGDCVQLRQILTVDIDRGAPENITQQLADLLPFTYLVHATASWTPDTPHVRVLIPLADQITADQYRGLVDWFKTQIETAIPGLEVDEATRRPAQLMYMPLEFQHDGVHDEIAPSLVDRGEWLHAGKTLQAAAGNVSKAAAGWTWGGGDATPAATAAKAGTTGKTETAGKTGTTGKTSPRSRKDPAPTMRHYDRSAVPEHTAVFNDLYTVVDVLNDHPEIYMRVGDRYKPVASDSLPGGIVYGNGQWFYTNHATDPAATDHILHAYDLALALYHGGGDSFTMNQITEFNRHLRETITGFADKVKTEQLRRQLKGDFETLPDSDGGANVSKQGDGDGDGGTGNKQIDQILAADWYKNLNRHPKSGLLLPTRHNLVAIVLNDPRLTGLVGCTIRNQPTTARGGRLPWKSNNELEWTETDRAELLQWIENRPEYDRTPFKNLQDQQHMYNLVTSRRPYNYVEDLISVGLDQGATINGGNLERLFIDYLGSDDNPYTRQTAVLMLAQLVQRATWQRPTSIAAANQTQLHGTALNLIPVLQGDQGLGKTTLLHQIGGTFYGSIPLSDVNDEKQLGEKLATKTLVEFAELQGSHNTSANTLKAVLTKTELTYRPAGAHGKAQTQPLRCVFVGTTNDDTFLTDTTGNRRFAPIRCGVVEPVKDVHRISFQDITILYAEAFLWLQHYRETGKPLDLDSAAKPFAEQARAAVMESNPWFERVAAYVAELEENTQGGPVQVTIAELWDKINPWQAGTMPRKNERDEIAAVLRQLGYRQTVIRVDESVRPSKRLKCFVKDMELLQQDKAA